MKTDSIFELKTMFDPLSPEWEKTNPDEKKKMMDVFFGGIMAGFRGAELREFYQFARYRNSNGEYDFPEFEILIKENPKNKPIVPYYNLLLAVGFYLNKYIDESFKVPETVPEVETYFDELKKLKDEKKKKTRSMSELMGGRGTRELFDTFSSESKSLTNEKKIERLKSLHKSGAAPIDVLFMHAYRYDTKNYNGDIFHEAAFSAFALCWGGDRVL